MVVPRGSTRPEDWGGRRYQAPSLLLLSELPMGEEMNRWLTPVGSKGCSSLGWAQGKREGSERSGTLGRGGFCTQLRKTR